MVLFNKQGGNEEKNEDGPGAYDITAEIVPYVRMGCDNAQHRKCPADVNPNNALMKVARLRYLGVSRQYVIKCTAGRLHKESPDCF
ncbi:hypothetical protein [Akkermansia sp.]|uniref:hypothetical protein n=1 Tax=Akkermansia sp. TaxID=1872421 RepID=UPI0025BB5595|nr:hypothetical protein [Akkermansia sp.]MCD8065314.1 hypothetical protein [Akkermansia sp.]